MEIGKWKREIGKEKTEITARDLGSSLPIYFFPFSLFHFPLSQEMKFVVH